MFQPKLSVITVVRNAVRDIERTMLSVLNQTYPHIEYLVIDGGSTDGTVALIEKYKGRIAKIISEKDAGIYDAMNKGLVLASGDYVLFMNAGDEIYAPDTVVNIFATQSEGDIYYGETEMYSTKWESLGQRRHCSPEKFDWRSFKYGMNISHQAIYVKRSLAQPYDLKYHFSSDIDWIIKVAKKATCIVNTHKYVAKYMIGGVSKKNHFESLKERFLILVKHYGFISTVICHTVIAANLFLYFIRHGKTND